jgi:hypothetical protein
MAQYFLPPYPKQINMKGMLFLTLVLLFGLAPSAEAQGDNVPSVVKETFNQQYPNAENVVYEDNLLQVWVNFVLNGDNMRANYTRKGQWKNTEKDWSYDQLPAAVKDGFLKSKYADREIEETKIIYRAGGTQWYRLKARKNGLQKKHLFFNEQGRLVEDSITL